MLILLCGLLVVLSVVIYQDFRYRAISAWTIPAIAVISAIAGLLNQSWEYYLLNTLINIALLVLQFALVSIYFIVRKRKVHSIINNQIGMGDILFILSLAFLMEPFQLIVVLILSLVVVLFTYSILSLLKVNVDKLIPLAGGISVVLFLLILYRAVFLPNQTGILPFNQNML